MKKIRRGVSPTAKSRFLFPQWKLAFALLTVWSFLSCRVPAAEPVDDQGSSAVSTIDPGSKRYFETRIAPLLARHCMDCHDSARRDGGLDLTHKATAFAGGDSGTSIVSGKSGDSLLWQLVESDEMPQNQAPLSDDEKQILRRWIDAGATWSLDAIDPEGYSHDSRAAEVWLQRLTAAEYIETVRSTLGVDIEADAARILPRDERAEGFTNTSYNLGVDLDHVNAYARLAKLIVSRIDTAKFAAKYADCNQLTDECMRKLISQMGKQLLRGPLSEPEVNAYLGVAEAVKQADGDFPEAAGYVIQAMLQSPRFIYRIERQRGDGSQFQADAYELASRMSYMIWGGPPDEKLMQAAETGALHDTQSLQSEVQRMLADPRAVGRSLQFIEEWLDLNRLETLRPNRGHFPHWNDQLAADMREETLAFFKDLAWEQRRPLWELLNAQFTYATPRLAHHYGLLSSSDSSEKKGYSKRTAARVTEGLQVLYTFDERSGDTVRDVSGAAEPLDLKIDNPKAVVWGEGGMTVSESTQIATAKPPKRLAEAIKKSKALTLEAWITPANTLQNGPARILTLSGGIVQRNFTLGQDGDRYDGRIRADKTDANGLPSQSSPSGTAVTALTHLVYTKDAAGRGRLFVNGEEQASGEVGAGLSKWDDGYRLAIANESSKDRAWKGTYHLIAIYDRALTPETIRGRGAGMSRYDVADNPARGGLLTQGSVLTIGGDEASMVVRGLFVLNDLLYSRVGNPPPCVDVTPAATKPGLTMRDQAEARLADSSCVGCHARFEPLAFGLEKFDGIGGHHEIDSHGNRLREDGEIHVPGKPDPVSYQTSAELMDLLAESERVQMAITRKVAQFALGRPLIAADLPELQEIHASARENGGTYQALMSALVMSDLVRFTRPESD